MPPDSQATIVMHSPQTGPGPRLPIKQNVSINLRHPLLQKIMRISNLAGSNNRPETHQFRQFILAAFAQEDFSKAKLESFGFDIGQKVWKSAHGTAIMDENLLRGLTPVKEGCVGVLI